MKELKASFTRILLLPYITCAFVEIFECVSNFVCTFKVVHFIEHINAKRFYKRILSDSIEVYLFFISLGGVVWPG